jgi:hypothetical protein
VQFNDTSINNIKVDNDIINSDNFKCIRIIVESNNEIFRINIFESIEIQKCTKQQIVQDIDNLENHKKFLTKQINRDRLKVFKFQELECIEFGLKELKIL